MLTPRRYRELRGLLIHFRKNWPWVRQARTFQRGIVPTLPPYGGTPGQCRWCQLPTERRLRWHPDCIDAYRASTGQSLHNIWGTASAPPCPCGQPATELDHQDALVLAWTSWDPRRIMRAYLLDTFTWLCKPCHAAKTRADLAALKAIRDQQTCLAGLITPQPNDKALGATDWILAEQGRITNLRADTDRITGTNTLAMRRVRVTFDPKETTCPRCLVAMERQENPTSQTAHIPTDWHLDERNYLPNLIPQGRTAKSPPLNQLALPLEH